MEKGTSNTGCDVWNKKKDHQRFPKCEQMTCNMAVQKNTQTWTISKNEFIIRLGSGSLLKWKSLAKKESKG